DLSDISEMAHKGPEVTLMASIRLLGASIIIATISWKLALALVIIAVLFTFILSKQNKKMKRIFLDNRVKISGMNSVLQDSLGGIRIVKAFANEILEQARFKKANKNYYESREDTSKAMASYMATTAIYFGMTHGAIIVLGGFLVIFGDLSAADLAISALYIGTFSFAIEAMINLMESFQKAGSGFRRFLEVMDMVPSIQDIPNAPKLHVSEGAIEYKHVNFSYEPNEPIIKDLNLRLEAGKTLALVGESGGGKTTICSLLMRFYEVDSGSILIDGQDIKTVSQESLRSAIGLVQQDVYLFDGTIYDNIAYGNMEASHEEIVLAAKKANISSFIDSLPDGYNTVVGERGTRLSGGQKQRIAIARIFLKDPKILILDEATSALDNESEHYVQESLNALAQGRTTLIIAHRLSTIKHADEIATIEQGRVIERGTHDELLAKGGTYAQYYEMQFAHQEF
ncbi:MAG: ABC transporter ATP-binding protein, partial [Coriobacteriia bacterium]|nr:ABC transporter ATP-binding protein [Coriobacteriia bacterium]